MLFFASEVMFMILTCVKRVLPRVLLPLFQVHWVNSLLLHHTQRSCPCKQMLALFPSTTFSRSVFPMRSLLYVPAQLFAYMPSYLILRTYTGITKIPYGKYPNTHVKIPPFLSPPGKQNQIGILLPFSLPNFPCPPLMLKADISCDWVNRQTKADPGSGI